MTEHRDLHAAPAANWLRGLVLILCLVQLSAYAARVDKQKDKLVVSGDLAVTDLAATDIPRGGTVVFQDSLGGTAEAAMMYADLISKNGLSTVVSGKCYSACAIAFLAGRIRTFDPARPVNALVFHMGRTARNGEVKPYGRNDELLAFIRKATAGKLDPEVDRLIANSWEASSGVAIVMSQRFWITHYQTLYCDGTQGLDTSRCRSLPSPDPKQMGILKD